MPKVPWGQAAHWVAPHVLNLQDTAALDGCGCVCMKREREGGGGGGGDETRLWQLGRELGL